MLTSALTHDAALRLDKALEADSEGDQSMTTEELKNLVIEAIEDTSVAETIRLAAYDARDYIESTVLTFKGNAPQSGLEELPGNHLVEVLALALSQMAVLEEGSGQITLTLDDESPSGISDVGISVEGTIEYYGSMGHLHYTIREGQAEATASGGK